MFETVATELPRILACNGSILLGGQKPPSNDDPTARDEGIAAHWLIEQAYNGRTVEIGTKAPNGITITHAIAASVVDFTQHILSRKFRQNSRHGFEYDCILSSSDEWRISCRPDFWSFTESILEIDDFKHGFRIVEPQDNWTMIAYALALENELTAAGIYVSNIVLRIHQPRVPHPAGTVREWRLTADELRNFYEYLDHTLRNLSNTLNTGPQCDKCPNVTICPAVRTASFNAVDVSLTAHSENMQDDTIGKELEILTDAEKRIKARKKQLEDLAIYRMKQGAIIPNYALERSFGNNVFKDDFAPEFLSAMLGVDVTKKDVITPAQAVKAGASEQLVKTFSTRKETGLKLTRANANDRATRMFGRK